MNFIITFKKERATHTPRSGRNLKPMICSIHRCMKQVRAIYPTSIDRAGQLYILLSYETHFSFHIIRNISFAILNNVPKSRPQSTRVNRISGESVPKLSIFFPASLPRIKLELVAFYRIEIIKQSQIQTLTKYDVIFSFLCIDS